MALLAHIDRAANAARRLGAAPRLEVRVKATTDDRRRKQYYRTICVYAPELPEDVSAYDIARQIQLHRSWSKLEVGDVEAWGEKERGDAGATWTWRAHAPRPSKILDEEEARELATRVFVPAITRAWYAAVKASAENKRRDLALDQARRIADWAAGKAFDEALAMTRYEQRLAALVAELQAEVAVQCRKLLDEGTFDTAVASEEACVPGARPRTPCACPSDAFEPEAIEAAKRHFPDFAKRKHSPGHGLFSNSAPLLTRSDLFEDEKK